jgi:hypothetical protein
LAIQSPAFGEGGNLEGLPPEEEGMVIPDGGRGDLRMQPCGEGSPEGRILPEDHASAVDPPTLGLGNPRAEVEEDRPMIRDRCHFRPALGEKGEHARRKEEAVKEGSGTVVGEGEGACRGVPMAKGVTEVMGGGELTHGVCRTIIPMRSEARRQRPPLQPPVHREVEVPSDDAVSTHSCQERVEASFNKKLLLDRIARGEVGVDEEERVTRPAASEVEEAPVLLPCHTPSPPHDAEKPIRQPVLPDEGGDPPKRPGCIARPDDLLPRSSECRSSGGKTVLHAAPRQSVAIPGFSFLHQDDISSKLRPPGAI